MKKIFLIFITFISFECKDNKKTKDMHIEPIKTNVNERLIDNIKIENNLLFNKDEINTKTYKYNAEYIENITIKNLLNENYRNNFVKYLENIKTEEDDFKSTLICQLLLLRITQTSDSNAFYILSEISKNELVSYNGIELYESSIIEIFLENPYFFIQQSAKFKDTSLLDYIIKILPQYIIDKNFLDMNLGYIKDYPKNENSILLLNPEAQKNLEYLPLIKTLKSFPKINIQLGPSFFTGFKTIEEKVVNISPLLGNDLFNKLNDSEKKIYKINLSPIISKYFIKAKFQNGIIQDPDGYTNLRKENNTTSEVLLKIKSGEEVEILDNSEDWWKIKTKEGEVGFIHKSRVKPNINSVSNIIRIYDRADFHSFSREIKGEVVFLSKLSDWDYVKIDGNVGYLPNTKQKIEKNRQSNFLADDNDIKTNKEKGFWYTLFG